jgi:hypothetical protein
MSRFATIKIRERTEGEPGFVEAHEFEVTINIDQITLFNTGEDLAITFIRMSCGATLCALMPIKKFKQIIEGK